MTVSLMGATAVAAAPAAASSAPSAALPVRVLKPADLGAYAAAFAAVRRGDFDTADAELKKVHDPCLVGRVTFEKLMSPTYSASFAELKTWLQKYHQLPGADRVWAVARKRQIASELPLPSPDPEVDGAADAAAWSRVERVAEHLEAPPKPRVAVSRGIEAAREAYYRGDVSLAYRLARTAGEHWVLGLSAYRTRSPPCPGIGRRTTGSDRPGPTGPRARPLPGVMRRRHRPFCRRQRPRPTPSTA